MSAILPADESCAYTHSVINLNKYLDTGRETQSYFAETRFRWLKQRLEICGAKPRNCLEFGCRTGSSASLLVEKFGLTHYTGYDSSPEAVELARQDHASATFHFTADVDELPANSFDLVFCHDVFRHIPIGERPEACERIFRSLKRDGWLVFWETNKWNPLANWLINRVPFEEDADMLFPSEADALMWEAGFQTVMRDYLFVFPDCLKFLRPLEPLLCKLPLGGQYLILARKK